MATFRKRGGKWHVQVRRKSAPSITRSFGLRSDALAWARQTELQADRRGLATAHKTLNNVLVADLVKRYRDEVVPRKRSAACERYLINAFLRHPIARLAVGQLTTESVSGYCAERLRAVKPTSIKRELDILRHAFEVARYEWDIPLNRNPFALVKRPKGGEPRSRRLQHGELERLQAALAQCRNRFMSPLVRLALATGMRRGEVLNARWCDVAVDGRTLHIPHAKNGHARTIPLSGVAISILRELDGSRPRADHRVVAISEDSAKMAWRRIVKRARLVDLRFHDLRHEAISRFFELGLNVPEVALISGHRDPRMLFRYTHPKAEV